VKLVILSEAKDLCNLSAAYELHASTQILRCAQDDKTA